MANRKSNDKWWSDQESETPQDNPARIGNEPRPGKEFYDFLQDEQKNKQDRVDQPRDNDRRGALEETWSDIKRGTQELSEDIRQQWRKMTADEESDQNKK